MQHDIIVILGATASGKTKLAAHLAYDINAEIISADSRQVYKAMNIGTGKDYDDYLVQGKRITYHLIDITEPGTKYNVYEYQKDFLSVYNDIKKRNKQAILCGGSGMYIESILKGYKLIQVPPNNKLRSKLEKKSMVELTEMLKSYRTLHNTSDITSKKRLIRALEIAQYYDKHAYAINDFPEYKSIVFGVTFDREMRRQRISERLKQRFNNGMVEEVRQLIGSGISSDELIYYGLEYKYITQYLLEELSYEDMVSKLETAIHQFAKRQMTWFRKMEREGFKINWLNGNMPNKEKIKEILSILNC